MLGQAIAAQPEAAPRAGGAPDRAPPAARASVAATVELDVSVHALDVHGTPGVELPPGRVVLEGDLGLEIVERLARARSREHRLVELLEVLAVRGIELVLIDDQTVPTREAIGIMQTNAALGLLLVLLTTWAFLGSRIAVLLSMGIPFSLAGAFAVIYAIGWTINVSILLGVVNGDPDLRNHVCDVVG